ncbi:MAG: formate dehydrogenase accessory sulfurtransferase FdhD [Acidimicrobiales bacterium]
MARGRTERVLVGRFDGDDDGLRRQPDELIVEEPMEIHLDGVLVNTTTMRTPGHDFELAAGFCHTEGLLAGATVRTCRYCSTGSAVDRAQRGRAGRASASEPHGDGVRGRSPRASIDGEFNIVAVETGGEAPLPVPRLGVTTSACGICGSTAVDDLRERLHPLPPAEPWDLRLLAAIPARLEDEQALFARTGGVHAAAAFDRRGAPVVVREDIGRHNAVDKVVGRLLLDERLPAPDLGLYVSGRASFEIVQKAWAAGMTVVVAVSAPSSLAVAAARLAGMTLCGFVRSGHLNIYSGTAG